MRPPIMLAIAAAFAALATSPVAAANEAPRANVRYGDLDLSGDAGANAMLRRINLAAAHVCGARSGPMPLSERIRTRQCQRAEAEAALEDVGNPALSARYYNQRGRVIIAAVR